MKKDENIRESGIKSRNDIYNILDDILIELKKLNEPKI